MSSITIKDGSIISISQVVNEYLDKTLDLVENVFAEYHLLKDNNPAEGKVVRALVEEIRSKKYYVPELDLMALNEKEEIIGYALFSKFHIEGRYINKNEEDRLLMLTPVAVKTNMQRKGISKALIEYGFEKARKMGYTAVLVEGDPKNYNPRGFVTSSDYGIVPGENIHLPRIECLMIYELVSGAIERMYGVVDYSFYKTLSE